MNIESHGGNTFLVLGNRGRAQGHTPMLSEESLPATCSSVALCGGCSCRRARLYRLVVKWRTYRGHVLKVSPARFAYSVINTVSLLLTCRRSALFRFRSSCKTKRWGSDSPRPEPLISHLRYASFVRTKNTFPVPKLRKVPIFQGISRHYLKQDEQQKTSSYQLLYLLRSRPAFVRMLQRGYVGVRRVPLPPSLRERGDTNLIGPIRKQCSTR